MTTILVTGDRNWHDEVTARRVIEWARVRFGDIAVRHGDARGVDRSFDRAAQAMGVPVLRHPADWDQHGKAAGPIRNSEMVKAGAEICIACHRDLASSRGTVDCVRKAIAADIPVYLVDSSDADPVRIEGCTGCNAKGLIRAEGYRVCPYCNGRKFLNWEDRIA